MCSPSLAMLCVSYSSFPVTSLRRSRGRGHRRLVASLAWRGISVRLRNPNAVYLHLDVSRVEHFDSPARPVENVEWRHFLIAAVDELLHRHTDRLPVAVGPQLRTDRPPRVVPAATHRKRNLHVPPVLRPPSHVKHLAGADLKQRRRVLYLSILRGSMDGSRMGLLKAGGRLRWPRFAGHSKCLF